MALRRLQVTDFRCLQSAELEFDSRLTLISGANASGKTSVLEAIYLLGRGRSFRTRRTDQVIRTGAAQFNVFGEVWRFGRLVSLGVEGSESGVRARMSGQSLPSLAELAAVLPVQVIDPEVHRLIEEGPGQRRRFLDWGVFHVEHSYIAAWRGYQKVLRQRNAALKARLPRAAVVAWDGELARLGEIITASRLRYMDSFVGAAAAISHRLLGLTLGLNYRVGWKRGESLAAALDTSLARDTELGATTVGPHRGDITILLDGAPVKDRVSRGQQKLLAASLLIAQVGQFPREGDIQPVLLLDDPAAELDAEHLQSLIGELASQPAQLVVTSLSSDFVALGTPGRCYRIDAGVLRCE